MSCIFDEAGACPLKVKGLTPKPLECVACRIGALAGQLRTFTEWKAAQSSFEGRTVGGGTKGARP